MMFLFMISMLAFIICIIGLIYSAIKHNKKKPWIIGIITSLIVFCFTVANHEPVNTKDTTSSSTTTEVTNTKDVETTTSNTQNLEWNKSELDALKNGNIPIAAQLVVKDNNLAPKAEQANPDEVIKRPWDYYGKVITFTGQVGYMQDYPKESEFGQAFNGDAFELVMTSGDTIVDIIGKGSTAGISDGQTITTYAYPVGVTEVPNKVGGSFKHLIVVGVIGQ